MNSVFTVTVAMINFATWDNLLSQYVDSQGRVNYQAWKGESSQSLNQWLAELEEMDIHSMSHPDEQLALWINLYNAFTIASILEHYPIASIQPKLFGVPNWIAFLWFFYRPTHKVAGRYYSLNHIEHNILRREFDEPRLHFALVCASIGCPLLRNGAYWSKSVRTQLEEDAIRFINNPDKVCYDSQTQTLYCSKIFKWYRKDFLKVTPSVPDYIRSYLKSDFPIGSNTPIAYLDYDWALNQQTGI
ncbi:MAG TPA: DUF547 domain-containing protein [Coleofasciculaceae cyanobacterium]|jgi:hypothetical protein